MQRRSATGDPTEDTALLDRLKRETIFMIRKCNSKEEKQVKAASLYATIEGIFFKVGLSKVGGRTIQLCLKFGSNETREKLLNKLLSSEHQFSELMKSNYGHYIGITMARVMPNAFKKRVFALLSKNALNFLVHSVIIEYNTIRLHPKS